jgi:hypothetical protein
MLPVRLNPREQQARSEAEEVSYRFVLLSVLVPVRRALLTRVTDDLFPLFSFPATSYFAA